MNTALVLMDRLPPFVCLVIVVTRPNEFHSANREFCRFTAPLKHPPPG